MDRGRVVQMGTHEQLAAEDGIYRQIYEMQGRLEDELDTAPSNETEVK